jgi:hypothetical protein
LIADRHRRSIERPRLKKGHEVVQQKLQTPERLLYQLGDRLQRRRLTVGELETPLEHCKLEERAVERVVCFVRQPLRQRAHGGESLGQQRATESLLFGTDVALTHVVLPKHTPCQSVARCDIEPTQLPPAYGCRTTSVVDRLALAIARTENPHGADVDLGRWAVTEIEPNGDYALFLSDHRPGRLGLGGMYARNPQADQVNVDLLTYLQS